MFIYQVWAKLPSGERITKGLIAQDRCEALTRAIERLKLDYGPGAKVTFVIPVINAGDVKRVSHSGLANLLNELDQLEFVAFAMRAIVRQSINLVGQLVFLLQEVKERSEEGDDYAS